MPKIPRNPKPKNRSTFTVRSLISNRKRNVNYVNKGATTCVDTKSTTEILPSSSVPELFEPTLRDDKTPQTWTSRTEKSCEEWNNLATKLRQTWVDHEAAIDGVLCVHCAQTKAIIRCKDCGPDQFFCGHCAFDLHSKRCCFHRLEKWENGFYSPFVLRKQMTSLLQQHINSCKTKVKIVKLVDDRGISNEVEFKFCSCEDEAAALLRNGFWPFSPQNPQSAISLELLDLIYLYMMECQVSLKRSCSAIKLLAQPFQHSKVNVPNVYKSLVNNGSFQQYCLFRYHLNYSVLNCDPGNVCPACPKDPDETIIHSFDACFGLVRKKSAGKSTGPPLLEGIFFTPQKDVDEYVASYSQKKTKISSDCNEFHAGEVQSMIRSKGKAKVFDEKAVLGGICRHEAPTVGFMNTKAGEKISFSIYYLQELLKKSSGQVFFIYDIGCILHKHIQNGSLKSMIDRVTLALPSFHCFGHKYSCQVKYGPKRCKGIGLSDGEATERLWSYLRRFSAITKEMTASNRINTLTLCLLHYMERSKAKLGKLLVTRLKKAKKCLSNSEEELSTLLSSVQGATTDKVAEWVCEESNSVLKKKDQTTPVTWKERYVSKLLELEDLRNEMTTTNNVDSVVILARSFKRKDAEIKKLEKSEKVHKRWLVTDAQVQSLARSVSICKQEEIKESLHKIALERWFLISLKSKYADGQSIAKKLSKSITKKTRELRTLLKKYNSSLCRFDSQAQNIDFATVSDPTDKFFEKEYQENSVFPLSLKRKAIDLHFLAERAKEEKAMVLEEMQRVITYYEELKYKLSQSVAEEISAGPLSVMKRELVNITNTIDYLTDLFSTFYEVKHTNSSKSSYHNDNGDDDNDHVESDDDDTDDDDSDGDDDDDTDDDDSDGGDDDGDTDDDDSDGDDGDTDDDDGDDDTNDDDSE